MTEISVTQSDLQTGSVATLERPPVMTTTADTAANLGASASVLPPTEKGLLGRLTRLIHRNSGEKVHDEARRAAEDAHPNPNNLGATTATEAPATEPLSDEAALKALDGQIAPELLAKAVKEMAAQSAAPEAPSAPAAVVSDAGDQAEIADIRAQLSDLAHAGYDTDAQNARRNALRKQAGNPDTPYFFATAPQTEQPLEQTPTAHVANPDGMPIADRGERIRDMAKRQEAAINPQADGIRARMQDVASGATGEDEIKATFDDMMGQDGSNATTHSRKAGLGRRILAGTALAAASVGIGADLAAAAEAPLSAPTETVGEKPANPEIQKTREFRYDVPGMPDLDIRVETASSQAAPRVTVTLPDGRIGTMDQEGRFKTTDGAMLDEVPEGLAEIAELYERATPDQQKAMKSGALKVVLLPDGNRILANAQGLGVDGNPVSQDQRVRNKIIEGYGQVGTVVGYETKTTVTTREVLAEGQTFDVEALMQTPEGRAQIDAMFDQAAHDVEGRLKPTPGIDGKIQIGLPGARGEHAKWSVVETPDGGRYEILFVEGARVVEGPDGVRHVVGGTYVIMRASEGGDLEEGAVMRLNNDKVVVDAEGPFAGMMKVDNEQNLDQTQVAETTRIVGEDGKVYLVANVGQELAANAEDNQVVQEICQADGGKKGFIKGKIQSLAQQAFDWAKAKTASIGQCVGFRRELRTSSIEEVAAGGVTVIEVSLPPDTPPERPPLPATGRSSTLPLAGAGLGAIGLGVGSALTARRLQRTAEGGNPDREDVEAAVKAALEGVASAPPRSGEGRENLADGSNNMKVADNIENAEVPTAEVEETSQEELLAQIEVALDDAEKAVGRLRGMVDRLRARLKRDGDVGTVGASRDTREGQAWWGGDGIDDGDGVRRSPQFPTDGGGAAAAADKPAPDDLALAA